MDFLCGRKQFVKLAVSSVSHVTAGTPQGIVSGPNDFKLIINDLQFYIGYLKFVDDTTTFSVSNDPYNCLLQKAADYSCVLDRRKRNGYKHKQNSRNGCIFR